MDPTLQQVNSDGTAVLQTTSNKTPDEVNQLIISLKEEITIAQNQLNSLGTQLTFWQGVQTQQNTAIANSTPAQSLT